MPDSVTQGTHNNEAGFIRRIEAFRASDGEGQRCDGLFEDNKVRTILVSAEDSPEHSMDVVRMSIGLPHNYDPLRAQRERDDQDNLRKVWTEVILI